MAKVSGFAEAFAGRRRIVEMEYGTTIFIIDGGGASHLPR